MRVLIAAAALGLIAHMSGGVGLPQTNQDEISAVAIECGEFAAALQRACESELEEDLRAGLRSAGAIIQMHCTRWRSPWDSSTETPPAICTERYGGWIGNGLASNLRGPETS